MCGLYKTPNHSEAAAAAVTNTLTVALNTHAARLPFIDTFETFNCGLHVCNSYQDI